MKALIVEDEKPAARQLVNILNETGKIDVLEITDSIKTTVKWLDANPQPDLIFMDIHIADGSAFKIFEHADVFCPVIFTTAYDEYALDAFKVNSIDYLLKPITKEAVEKALSKHSRLTSPGQLPDQIQQLLESMRARKTYQTHFLIPLKGSKMVPVLASDIACFSIDSGKVTAKTFDGKSYPLDFTLDEITARLDPDDFYRANRQFIVAKKAIEDVDFWFGSRLSINLKIPVHEKILVSRTKVSEFNEWFSGR
jgi:two-component system LytT family response regulator